MDYSTIIISLFKRLYTRRDPKPWQKAISTIAQLLFEEVFFYMTSIFLTAIKRHKS